MLDRLDAVLLKAAGLALGRQAELAAVGVDRKGRLDFVTDVDRGVERMLADEIRRLFPDDGFFGEEGARWPGTSGTVWVVDPIDGTHNFITGARSWAISVGAVTDGRFTAGVIAAPAEGLTLSADPAGGLQRNGTALMRHRREEASVVHIGVSTWMPSAYDRWLIDYLKDDAGLDYRRTGSAATSLLAVVQGEADLYIGFGEHAWDVAGGAALAEAAGLAHNLDWSGGIPSDAITFVCGEPRLVDQTLAAIASGLGKG